MQNLSKQTLESAKGLAPWRTSLPWWVVLIEGGVIAVTGLLVLLNPGQSSINVALLLSAALLVAGLIQLWNVLRRKAPQEARDAAVARGAIAVYAGANILLLWWLDALPLDAGLLLYGLAAVIFGVLGIIVSFSGATASQRRTTLVEVVIFTLSGLLLLYVVIAGPAAITTAMTIIGWVLLIGGLALIALAIWRWRKGPDADAVIDSVVGLAGKSPTSSTEVPTKDGGENAS